MTIKVGDTLPDATFTQFGDKGITPVSLGDLAKGKKLVLFGLPGAFTGTCSARHLPSFMNTAEAFRAKGVDHIVCVSVNDPFVMNAWDKASGASGAGVQLVADGDGSFARAIGMAFSNPKIGFLDRCKRFAAYAEDGVIKVWNPEPEGGACEISAGETLLEQI
ncbi:MAG: peroxiredoxin [Rhodobacteraceae bacterium]|nr:peroxiredoxin [Paracoccaceae bacterium]